MHPAVSEQLSYRSIYDVPERRSDGAQRGARLPLNDCQACMPPTVVRTTRETLANCPHVPQSNPGPERPAQRVDYFWHRHGSWTGKYLIWALIKVRVKAEFGPPCSTSRGANENRTRRNSNPKPRPSNREFRQPYIPYGCQKNKIPGHQLARSPPDRD